MAILRQYARQVRGPGELTTPEFVIQPDALRRIRVTVDAALATLQNPAVHFSLFLQVLRDGLWLDDAGITYTGGVRFDKQGNVLTTPPGFQVLLSEYQGKTVRLRAVLDGAYELGLIIESRSNRA